MSESRRMIDGIQEIEVLLHVDPGTESTQGAVGVRPRRTREGRGGSSSARVARTTSRAPPIMTGSGSSSMWTPARS